MTSESPLPPAATSLNVRGQPGRDREYEKPLPISEMVFRHLAREIVQGVLLPGQRLTETALCETYNCSRSPLREAIRMLAADGLVIREPRRGVRVVALSEKDVSDLYRLRETIEGLAVRLAAENGTDTEFTGLADLNEEMASAVAQGDSGAYFALNSTFHHTIAQIGGNRHVAAIQQSIAAQSLSPLFRFGTSTRHLLNSLDDHAGILDALMRRDPQGAEDRMRAHIGTACLEAGELIRNNAHDGRTDGRLS